MIGWIFLGLPAHGSGWILVTLVVVLIAICVFSSNDDGYGGWWDDGDFM